MATATKVKLQPLGDYCLVKPIQGEEKTKGGVILPDTAKEKPQEGEVLAVGSGRVLDSGQKIPMEVKIGDRVLYGKYSGTEIKLEGDDFLLIHEKDLLAIMM
ncbi:MAG: co-chaperone GroES [Armatimonadetes bacterium]|nr:co-chaperone GroES [Armatimonadota bacterium]